MKHRAETKPGREGDAEGKQSRWTWIIPLGLLILLTALYFAWPPFETFIDEAISVLSTGERTKVEPWVKSFGSWGYAVILALILLQTVLAFLPSIVTMAVSVLAYGPVVGGLLAWGGLLVAACLGYGIGRSLGPVTVDRLIGREAEEKVSGFVERHGAWAVVAARLSPVLSTDAVSFVAGLVKMRFFRFLLATAGGTLPLIALIGFLASDGDRLKTGLIVLSVASVVSFAGYLVYVRVKGEG